MVKSATNHRKLKLGLQQIDTFVPRIPENSLKVLADAKNGLELKR
jgi:hypothetical protein